MYGFGLSFWNSFLLIFVLHFIVFGIMNYVSGIIASYKLRQLQAQEIEALTNQSVSVQCAKCDDISVVPIIVSSTDNEYVCANCDTKNRIIVSVEGVLPTTPVVIENLDPDSLLQDQIKKLDKNE
jgi:hypothetical protein